MGGVVPVAGAVCTVPALQAVEGKHIVWLGPEVKVPGAHGEHFWSVVTLPTVEMKDPGGQAVHAVQLLAPKLALKLPLGQPAQARSAVALPADDSNSPGLQVIRLMQTPSRLNCSAPQAPLPPSAPLPASLVSGALP